MNTTIVACKTLENELLAAMEQVGCPYPVLWLEQGLHNWPDRLRREVQRLLDGCTDCDRVLLAMSLCGNAVAGLQTHDFSLILPRCDDCITLLLGSPERRREWPDTYFLTRGWLESDLSLWAEYETAVEKYGEKRGKRIFSTMLRHYHRLALVDTGCFDAAALKPQVTQMAQALALKPVYLEGSLDYLKQLLTAPWPPARFMTIPPHSTVELENGKGAEHGI